MMPPLDRDNLPQFYATEIWDPDTGLGVAFTTIPARSFANPEVLEVPEHALEDLDALEMWPLHITDTDLPLVIAAMLTPGTTPGARSWRSIGERPNASRNLDARVLEFSEYVAYAEVVPFENSPLAPDSLAKLIASGGGAGVGAFIGILAAGGPTPLLFITVPAGMIICGSAQGVADGASEGLRHRVREWIKGKQ
jgi:hypothetical protein